MYREGRGSAEEQRGTLLLSVSTLFLCLRAFASYYMKGCMEGCIRDQGTFPWISGTLLLSVSISSNTAATASGDTWGSVALSLQK